MTGKVKSGITSVRQPVFGERWSSDGGKVETLIMHSFSLNDEGSESFVL